MLITGTFKDIDNNTIVVDIYNRDITGNNITIGLTDNDDVYFASDTLHIESQCDDTFTHVIKRSCTISLVTKIYLGDYLFANNMRSIVVNVYKNNVCIFAGYVTPNTYSQGYSNVYEQLDIQCIDVLSCMQYEYLCGVNTYETDKSNLQLSQFSNILEQVDVKRSDFIINNYPVTSLGEEIWVETGFTTDGKYYYALETKVIKLNNNAAINTNEVRQNESRLTVTYVQSSMNDTVVVDGKYHYKNYIYVTINGTPTNTGNWIVGDELPPPEVVEIIWTVTGVVRETVNLYHTEETATAILSDNSTIKNYDYRWGSTSLPYTLEIDTIQNTMYSGSTEYLKRLPCVTYDNKKYYFPQDAEVGVAINTYDIIVETIDDDFRPGGGTITEIGRTRFGTYLFGINHNYGANIGMMLYGTNINKAIIINHNYNVDCNNLCHDCTSLEYVRIDAYSFSDIEDIFYNCRKLSNIVLNVITTYVDGAESDFYNLPSWTMIYVQDSKISEYSNVLPYSNYTVLPMSDLGIMPLED